MVVENARIERTTLGVDVDHHILTAYVHLKFGHGSQGFGGFEFGSAGKPASFPAGLEFIRQVLRVVGVTTWEELPGKYLRVERDGRALRRIENILKEHWFNPEEQLKGLWGEVPAASEKPEEESC